MWPCYNGIRSIVYYIEVGLSVHYLRFSHMIISKRNIIIQILYRLQSGKRVKVSQNLTWLDPETESTVDQFSKLVRHGVLCLVTHRDRVNDSWFMRFGWVEHKIELISMEANFDSYCSMIDYIIGQLYDFSLTTLVTLKFIDWRQFKV